MPLNDLILTNARIVLEDRVIERGYVAMAGELIVDVGEGAAPERGIDLKGDLLVPGLVELHTDHIEAHYHPRPGVVWQPEPAAVAYDAQIAASGITTVFDCFRVGEDERKDVVPENILKLIDAVAVMQDRGLLRARHFTHLRCEVCSPDVVTSIETMLARHPAQLMSLMDHTPGQRQFRDLEKLKSYYRRSSSMNELALDAFMTERIAFNAKYAEPHRRALVSIARKHGIKLASHDDTTTGQVAEAISDGVSIAEFPVTAEAASASHAAGIHVLMGAPNVVRGGSHSGNIAAIELALSGTLDILSSDYIPASLLLAAYRLPGLAPSISLPAAIRMVTAAPARAAGLLDRGVIEPGRLADLVRINESSDVPVVRAVWRGGERVT